MKWNTHKQQIMTLIDRTQHLQWAFQRTVFGPMIWKGWVHRLHARCRNSIPGFWKVACPPELHSASLTSHNLQQSGSCKISRLTFQIKALGWIIKTDGWLHCQADVWALGMYGVMASGQATTLCSYFSIRFKVAVRKWRNLPWKFALALLWVPHSVYTSCGDVVSKRMGLLISCKLMGRSATTSFQGKGKEAHQLWSISKDHLPLGPVWSLGVLQGLLAHKTMLLMSSIMALYFSDLLRALASACLAVATWSVALLRSCGPICDLMSCESQL